MRLANLAVRERPPRLHRNLPEQHFTQLIEQLFDKIRFAHGYAARSDHHVGALRGGGKRALELLRHIFDDAHVHDVAVEPGKHAVERVAVTVVDLSGRERRANRLQLIAGGKESDANLPIDGHLTDAQRRDHSKLGGPYPLPGAKHHLSRLEIFSGETTVLTGLA